MNIALNSIRFDAVASRSRHHRASPSHGTKPMHVNSRICSINEQSDVFYGSLAASWGSDDALAPCFSKAAFHGDADAWLDLVNLYGPAMTVKECLSAFQSLSKMIANSPSARSQHKLPIFRKAQSLLHRCFFKSLVNVSGYNQDSDVSILDQAVRGLERSNVKLADVGVILVSIAATQDKSRSFLSSSASSVAWVLSLYFIHHLKDDHGLSSEELMHWIIHPLSKIYGDKMDISSPSSPWKHLIAACVNTSPLSLLVSKSVLEVYDRCKQLPSDSILSSIYQSCKHSSISTRHDANTLSSLIWLIARIQSIKREPSIAKPLPPDEDCMDHILSTLAPHLPDLRGLPARITPVLSLINNSSSSSPSPAQSHFIQSYYNAMHSFLSVRVDDEIRIRSRHQAMRESGAREEEAKATLYDLSEAVLALPSLFKLPSHLQPTSDYINLLLDAVLSSLNHFLHLLSMRPRSTSQSFVPASLIDVITITAHKIKPYGFNPNTQWLKECCELSRPALARINDIQTFADLSEAVSSKASLSNRWRDDFCQGVVRLLSDPGIIITPSQARVIVRFVERLVPSSSSKICLEALKRRSSSPSPELKALIGQLSRAKAQNTLALVDRLVNIILDTKSNGAGEDSVANVTRGVGIAIKALSELKGKEPAAIIRPDLILRLLSLASFLAPHMTFAQISQVLLFSSRICSADTMTFWLDSASSSLAMHLTKPTGSNRISIRDVSMVLQATSRLKYLNEPLWMDTLLDSVVDQLKDAKLVELVILFSSLAYQKYCPCEGWTEAALASVKNCIDRGDCQSRELSSIGASLQALSIRPDFSWNLSFVAASEAAVVTVGQDVSNHSIVDHLSFLSFLLDPNLAHPSNDRYVLLRGRAQVVASHLVTPSLISQLTPGDLIRCLEAIWKLHMIPSRALIDAILSQSAQRMNVNAIGLPNHLIMSIWQLLAYAKYRPSDDWIRTFSSWSEPRFTKDSLANDVDVFTPLQLVKIFHSMARLGVDMKQMGHSWITGFKSSISHLIPKMNISLKSQLAWSIARTGIDKRDRLMDRIARSLPSSAASNSSSDPGLELMLPSQAASLLWSMSKAGYSPPPDYIQDLLTLFDPLITAPPPPHNHQGSPHNDDGPAEIMTPRLLCLLSSSLAALRYQPKDPSFTQSLLDQCFAMRQYMGPQSLALSLRSLVTLNSHQANEEWLLGMIESCVESAESFNADEAGMICMAISECCPPRWNQTLDQLQGGLDQQPRASEPSQSIPIAASSSYATRVRDEQGRPVMLRPPSKPVPQTSTSTAPIKLKRQSRLQQALVALSSSLAKKFTGNKMIEDQCIILNDISTVV